MSDIETMLTTYNEIQRQRKALKHNGEQRNPELDRQAVELMLEIEKTHTLYFDIHDACYKVNVGPAPRLYLGQLSNWRQRY